MVLLNCSVAPFFQNKTLPLQKMDCTQLYLSLLIWHLFAPSLQKMDSTRLVHRQSKNLQRNGKGVSIHGRRIRRH